MSREGLKIVDFHSHVLPGIDDGASDIEESVKLLGELSAQGIDKVVLTSHFYGSGESSERFLDRRDNALSILEAYITENDLQLPELVAASEVRLYNDMHKDENLSRLCIGTSRYILVEMPYAKWTPWMYNEVYALTATGYIPVMAHVERYIDFVSKKDIEDKLLSLDVLVQCNADSFLGFRSRRYLKRLIKQDRVSVIGSDCHNLTARPPKLAEAMQYICKKYGEEYLDYLMYNADEILLKA